MKNICVFCGSSAGTDTIYTEVTQELARLFIDNQYTLVYGGGKIGLMGVMADEMLKNGGKVIGVIPDFLWQKEVGHRSITHLINVETMQERKDILIQKSDAFIALPGGFGTLDEIFEVISLAQLQLHKKPCAFLNINGFYDYLDKFITHAFHEGFIAKAYYDMLIIESKPATLIDRLLHYTPPCLDKAKEALK